MFYEVFSFFVQQNKTYLYQIVLYVKDFLTEEMESVCKGVGINDAGTKDRN
jgi:hypothetical protein